MQTRKIALGGIITALALTIMLVGGLIGIGTYAAPLIAGVLLVPIGSRLGPKWHLAIFAAVSILSFVLVPDVEESLMFAAFFGWYPILYPRLKRIIPAIFRILTKLAVFNVCVIAAEALLLYVLLPSAESSLLLFILLLMGNVVFLLYDRVLPRMEFLLEKLLHRIHL